MTRWSSSSSSRRAHGSAARALAGALIALALALGAAAPAAAAPQSTRGAVACSRIDLFHREGCPHCARGRAFAADLAREIRGLEIVEHDVIADAAAGRAFLERMARLEGVTPGVPLFDVCGTLIIGFDGGDTTGVLLRRLVLGGSAARGSGDDVDLPMLGRVRAAELGLPLFTVVVGLVDGFNPCAMWVLLFLLSILVNLRSRARILTVAGTFVAVSGVVYFAFMAAWLQLFLVLGLSRALQVALGLLALLVAAVNLKDFAAPGGAVSLSIPQRARPGIHARVRAVVQADNLAGAVVAVVVLAVMVNLLELLCTAGLPALYTQILSRQGLGSGGYYAYLALYNVAYVFDDMLMVGLVTWTLRRTKMQAGAGRWLKLVSGVVVGLLGLILLLRPDWLY